MKLRIVMPASLFGAVLGLAGLANVWRLAHTLWHFPTWPGAYLSATAVFVWLACLTLYLAKWTWQRGMAQDEVRHPINGNFLILIPVSTMLISILVLPYSQSLARLIYTLGTVGAVMFGVWQQGAMLQGGRNFSSATAVIYMPSVGGNFVAAIGAGTLGMQVLAQVFFGAGLLSWLAIESVLMHRMWHNEGMAPAIRGTFGVQLAPPAVGLVALFAATDSPPQLFALMLFGYAIVQVLVAIRLLRWLLEGGFGLNFWSFAFGVTALAIGAERLSLSGLDLASHVAPWLFLIANGVVGAIAVRSVWLLKQGVLLPLPEPASECSSAC